MAVRRCAGDCGRIISISVIPGGNPTALADPRNWAVDHAACTAPPTEQGSRWWKPGRS